MTSIDYFRAARGQAENLGLEKSKMPSKTR